MFIANTKGTSVWMSVPEDGLKDRRLERPPRVRRVAPKGSSGVWTDRQTAYGGSWAAN